MEHMAPFCVVAAGICWGIIGLFTRQLSAYGLSPLQITFGRALVTAIAMAWLIDSCILDFMQLNVARLFTGFTCGVELWSFLENAAQLSDAPLFRWLRRYVHRRIRKEAGDE